MSHPFQPQAGFPTAPQQPQAPHPTVPYGQPGGPAAVVLPPNAPFPGQHPQQQQQFAPQPQPQQQVGFPPAPQQPQTFPQGPLPFQPQPVQQQQQPLRGDIPDNFVLDGPGIPPEMRGRTWAQYKQVYGALAQDFVQRPGMQAAPRPNAPQQPQVQQQQQQPQGRPAQPQTGSFWEDPDGAIDRAVQRQLAPIMQRSVAQDAQTVMENAKREIPDYAQLESEIIPIMRAAAQQNPELLTSMDYWKNAARAARGLLMERGQYQFQQPSVQQPQNPAFANGQQPQRGPGSFIPTGQFFTEAPTPPANGTFISGPHGGGQRQITAEQSMIAKKMGLTDQEWLDWSGGIQPTQASRRW